MVMIADDDDDHGDDADLSRLAINCNPKQDVQWCGAAVTTWYNSEMEQHIKILPRMQAAPEG